MSRHLNVVRKKLLSYADRGVLRNFQEIGTKGSKTVFVFDWLERRKLVFIYDDAKKSIQFKNCMPNADDDVAQRVREYLRSRTERSVPAHRRIDPGRATAKFMRRDGHGSLVVEVRHNQLAYAVGRLLNLLNEVFVQLHGEFFEYMIREFDVSQD